MNSYHFNLPLTQEDIEKLHVGDSVTVSGGLFEGYTGTVQAISDDLKNVTVLIKRGNRDMPVELESDEVKLLAAQN